MTEEPRLAASANRNPYAPPADPTLRSAEDDVDPRDGAIGDDTLDKDGFPRGWRIAGWLFIVHGVLRIVDMIATASVASNGPVAGVMDMVVGVGLLGGKHSYRTWGLVRMALGIAMVLVQASQGAGAGAGKDALSPWVLVPSVLAFGGIATCLIGKPRTPQIIAGVTAFGALVLVEMVGLFVMAR